jgi:hypothetical protein
MGTCMHPENARQKLHHHGVPVESCRACGRSRSYTTDSSAWRDRGDLSQFRGDDYPVREMPGRRHPRADAEAACEAMREAGFPVVPPGQIDAEVAADVHRLGLDRKPGLAQR